MAEEYFWPNPYDTTPQAPDASGGASLLDYPKAAGAALFELPAQAASAVQYGAEGDPGNEAMSHVWRGISMGLHGIGQSISDTISPAGKRAAEAQFIPDQDHASVFAHPFDSFLMKAAGMAPQLGVMMAFPESIIAQGIVGGTMQAGQVIDNAISETNNLNDAELQLQSPVYRHYRETMDEQTARAQLHDDQLQGKDIAAAGIVGALGMGATGRVLKSGASAGRTFLGRGAAGALEGGAGMGAAGADVDYSAQRSRIAMGAQDQIDWHRTLAAGLNAGFEGGILGGGAGVIHKAPDGRRVREGVKPEVSDPVIPDAEQRVALEANQDKPTEAPSQVTPGETPSKPAETTSLPAKVMPEAPPAAPPSPVEVRTAAPDVPPPEVAAPPAERIPEAPPQPVTPEPTPHTEDDLARLFAPETPPTPPSTPAATPETPRKPRVLRDETAPDVTYKPPGLAADEEAGEAAPKGKNWTKAELAKRAQDADNAREIFDAHVPDKISVPGSKAEKDALQARLQDMLKAAKDVDINIPTRVGYEGTPDHIVYLREAQQLANKLDKGRATYADIATFLASERAAKKGDFEPLREKRKVEGELANRREQAVGGTGNVGVKEEGRAASPVRKIELTEEQKKAALAALEKSSQKRVPKENEIPDIAAVKSKFSNEENEFHRHLTEQAREFERARDTVVNPKTGEAVTAPHIGKLKDVLAKHASIWGDAQTRPGLNRILYPQFKRIVQMHAGDVPVHVVDTEQMRALVKGRLDSDVSKQLSGKLPAGGYDPVHNRIFIHERVFEHPEALAQTLVHEGVHAAFDRVTKTDTKATRTINTMMEHVQRYLTEFEVKTGERQEQPYGLTNPREFVTEAFSNPDFQNLLGKIDAPPDVVHALGMQEPRRMTMWDVFVNAVRKFLGMGKNQHSLMEAALRLGQHLSGLRVEEARAETDTFQPVFRDWLERKSENLGEALAGNPVEKITNAMRDIARTQSADTGNVLQRIGRFVETNDQFRQRVESYFPGLMENNVVRKVFDTIERQGVHARKLMSEGNDITTRMIRAEKQTPGAFTRFAKLINDSTMYGVDPSSAVGEGRNKYLTLSKEVQKKLANGVKWDDIAHEVNSNHWEAHNSHPELVREYNELVGQHPEYANLLNDTFDFFKNAQEEMSRGHIQNILRAVTKDDEATIKSRAQEFMDARSNDEFRQTLESEFDKPTADEIIQAKRLSGREGPYAPLMRHGDWVVQGRYKIKEPTNAIQKIGDTYEFKTRKEASDFARSNGLYNEISTAYYDPATGEKTTKAGGLSTAGSAEQRWTVTPQTKHVEFHTRKSAAIKAFEELRKHDAFESVNAPEQRRDPGHLSAELGSTGLQTILNKLEQKDSYKQASPEQKNELRRALIEASLSMQSGNRVQSRRLPRRRVEGASEDLARNFMEYNTSQAFFRAKQEYRPQIDQHLRDMREQGDKLRYEDPQRVTKRSEFMNEIEKRARAQNPDEYTGAYTDWARRLSTWSYIYRMGRASHLILHQTHLPMITAPVIAGRHGAGKAYGSVLKAWKEAWGAYGAGKDDVINSIKDGLHKGVDYTALMKEAFSKSPDGARLSKLFDYLGEIGFIHPQYEVEARRHLASMQFGGPLGYAERAINKFDTVFRHATNATEAINRYVGSAAAYRLEYSKLIREGKNADEAHTLAMEYARNTLANTQGVYSATNAAPLFKNKWLRPFMQFRQFPQMIYNLMSKTLVKAVAGETTREKVEAASSLLALLSTHTLMTGVLGGLPLETAKIAGQVTKGLGITNGDWSDVERWQYDQAVKMFGKTGADYVMHGLSRALGLDAHHRLGLSSFFTFGLPEGAENDAKGNWAWLGQQLAGAPGGLAADAFKGVSKIMGGDVGAGLAALSPQALRDVYKGWNMGGGGYKYTSFGEAATRILGFTPSAEAEHYERRAETKSLVQTYNRERSRLTYKWIEAEGSDKQRIWAQIQKWNKDKPKDAQITLKNLTDAAKRKKQSEDDDMTVNGVRLNKRTRFIGERANAIY